MDVTEKVTKGAELLDRYYGNGEWRNKINVGSINMSDGFVCIIGQLFLSYSDGVITIENKLGLPYYDGDRPEDYWVFDHGFNVDVFESELTFDDLTEAWKQYLR